ncbi:MAG TPA: hypothetical protein PK668_21940 [Myxococcota bacterium]|nr:hypothetical protein [Myxococcota bacterium]HRY96363.1 hypothetical protein [Myxococcota bacterium]
MRCFTPVLLVCACLGLGSSGCYPDETGSDLARGLRIPLGALDQPVSDAALGEWISYLQDSVAYADFDFNVPGADFFLGLHLIHVVSADPFQEEELAFGASGIEVVSDPVGGEQALEMDLLLPDCDSCYFTLRLYARTQTGIQTFLGSSGTFEVGPNLSPGPVAMEAILVGEGLARCVDDAAAPASVRVSARDMEERVRLPEVATAAGLGAPEAQLAIPAVGPFELQFFSDSLSLWRTFAQVAFSYEDQEIEVRFDHTK